MGEKLNLHLEEIPGNLCQVVNVETLCRGAVQEVADGEGDIEDGVGG